MKAVVFHEAGDIRVDDVPEPKIESPHDAIVRITASATLASTWAVKSPAKAGTLSIIGVYPESDQFFPIGMAMNKNLTVNMGNCNHRKYLPDLVSLVATGAVDPIGVLTNVEELADTITACKAFDQRKPGWVKVELVPGL